MWTHPLDFLPQCAQPLSSSPHLLLSSYTAATHSDLQLETCSSFIFYWPMVHKWKTMFLLTQSVQINPLSAHITPPVTPSLSPGTLPLGESGCIPEHLPFLQTSSVPTQATPQSTHSTPFAFSGSTSKTRKVCFAPPPSSPSSDRWSTEEDNDVHSPFYDEYSTHLFDNYDGSGPSSSSRGNHSHYQGNILLDGLANDINSLIFGLNDTTVLLRPHVHWVWPVTLRVHLEIGSAMMGTCDQVHRRATAAKAFGYCNSQRCGKCEFEGL